MGQKQHLYTMVKNKHILEPERRILTGTLKVWVQAVSLARLQVCCSCQFPLPPKYVDYGKANNSSLQLVVQAKCSTDCS